MILAWRKANLHYVLMRLLEQIIARKEASPNGVLKLDFTRA